MCVQLWEKNFIVTPAARQQKIIFFDEPTIKKMCQDLKHSVKKRQQIFKKTHTAQTSPTRALITKAKHMTTDLANNSKVTTRGMTPSDTNKEIKGNGACKKARNI